MSKEWRGGDATNKEHRNSEASSGSETIIIKGVTLDELVTCVGQTLNTKGGESENGNQRYFCGKYLLLK